MKESKLVQTFLLLRPGEQHACRDFLAALPTVSEDSLRLFDWLTTSGQAENWDKFTAFQALFPPRTIKEPFIRKQMSALLKGIKQFLMTAEIQEDPWLAERLFLTQLRKRQASVIFPRQLSLNLRKLEQAPFRDGDYYFTRYAFASEANGMYGQQHARKLDHNLQDKVHFLDAWYVGMKLKESCEMLNRQNVLATQFTNPLLPEVLQALKDQPELFGEIPAIQVYYQIYRCLTEEQPEHFQALVEILQAKANLFQPEEARGMYKHAQNFCIRQINAGKTSYLQEVFQLYQQQLDNGIIFQQAKLAPTDFKNIVRVGLRLKEFAWVRDFLKEYQHRILPPEPENVYHFCLASWHAENGQPQPAIQLLQQVNFSDVYYDISARHLLLRVYFDQEEWESALYTIQAFSTFLRRNKQISRKNQVQHKHFLRWCKRLVDLKDRQLMLDQPEYERRKIVLQTQIQQADQVANREWLLEKLEEE